MTPASIRSQVVIERAAWVRSMLDDLRSLPLESLEEFAADLAVASRATYVDSGF